MLRILIVSIIMVFGVVNVIHASDFEHKKKSGVYLNQMNLEDFFDDRLMQEFVKASGSGDIRTMKHLMSLGININAQGMNGGTALYWAFRKKI